MGKQPSEYIQIKYSSQSSDTMQNVLLNALIGSLFVMFIYQIYKGRNKGAPGAGAKKPGTPTNKKEGGWF